MKTLTTLVLALAPGFLFSQSEIDIYEATLILEGRSEKELHYGFAEGDQIVFSFATQKRKRFAEVEISEHSAQAKFTDAEAKKIENKRIVVLKKGIYKFRLSNKSKRDCACKIKIQRIPASENTRLFNPEVAWITKQDTIWNTYTKDILLGYDTLKLQKTRKDLVKTDLTEEPILDKSQKVHSTNNKNGNKSSVFFTLPGNTNTELLTKKVTGWAFWVGVGDEANKAWEKNSKTISAAVQGAGAILFTPLGGLLLGTVADLMLPSTGEDVSYSVVDEKNKNLFFKGQQYQGYDHGKGVAGYKKFQGGNLLSGTWYIVLANDNTMFPINVNVKVVALIETKTYKHVTYVETKVTPKYEKRIFKDPKIITQTLPILKD